MCLSPTMLNVNMETKKKNEVSRSKRSIRTQTKQNGSVYMCVTRNAGNATVLSPKLRHLKKKLKKQSNFGAKRK